MMDFWTCWYVYLSYNWLYYRNLITLHISMSYISMSSMIKTPTISPHVSLSGQGSYATLDSVPRNNELIKSMSGRPDAHYTGCHSSQTRDFWKNLASFATPENLLRDENAFIYGYTVTHVAHGTLGPSMEVLLPDNIINNYNRPIPPWAKQPLRPSKCTQ
jgi:hypothetical protein